MIYKFYLYQPRDAPSIHFIDYRLKKILERISIMKKESICNIEHYSVLIPYKDLEKMLQCTNRIEEIERFAKRIDERYAVSLL